MSVVVKPCAVEQAGKSVHAAAMLSIETVGSSDLNIVFIIGVFLQFGNQFLFKGAGVQERTARELSDKDAASGVVAVVAGMDADTLKTRYVVQQWKDTPEFRRFGQRQSVPSEGDRPLWVLCVGYGGRFKRAAERLAADKQDARCFVGRCVGSD